jgi:hypothetical protein
LTPVFSRADELSLLAGFSLAGIFASIFTGAMPLLARLRGFAGVKAVK